MAEPTPQPKHSLSELVAALGRARTATTNAYEAYKELKSIEDQLRYELELQLRAEGLKSVKGADFTANITETPQVVIRDEGAVMEWLRDAPNVDSDHYIGLKAPEFKSLAKAMLKDTGEMVPGTDIETREALTIRANKKAKE